MENIQTLVKDVEQKVSEAAATFHAVETKVLQEVIDFLVKQPFESVNHILVKLNRSAKPVTLTEVPPQAPAAPVVEQNDPAPSATPSVEAEPTNIELPIVPTPVTDAEIVTAPAAN